MIQRLYRSVGVGAGMLVGLALLPIAIPMVLWGRLFGRPANLTRAEVASFIRSGLDPIDDGRWDEFENMSLRDPELDALRQQAVAVKFPLNAADRGKLEMLLVKLEG